MTCKDAGTQLMVNEMIGAFCQYFLMFDGFKILEYTIDKKPTGFECV